MDNSSVEFNISINNNDKLSDLLGFSKVDTIWNDCMIYNNDAPGCNSQAEVDSACVVASIEELWQDKQVLFYPNPATDKLNFSPINGILPVELNIYNSLGQRVLHSKYVSNSFDISHLPEGLFIVELVTEKHKIRKKLIIRR